MEAVESYQSYFLLLPHKDEEPELKYVKGRLNKTLNENFVVEMKREKDDHVPYSELIMKIDCDFSSCDYDQIKRIISRSCETNVFEGIGESMLVFEKALTFDVINTRNNEIGVESFSLGSLIGMNTFVEHYNSSWSKISANKRITQLKVDFVHDYSKIVIKFVVADRQQIMRDTKDGKSHRLHCMEINYNTIQAIVIKEKTSNHKLSVSKYDLYLQIYSAPILKKVELKRRKFDDDYDEDEFDQNYKNYKDMCDFEDGEESSGIFHDDFYQYVSTNSNVYQVPLMRAVCFGGDDSDEIYKIVKTTTPFGKTSETAVVIDGSVVKNAKKKKKNTKPKTDCVMPKINVQSKQETMENDAFCSAKTLGTCRTFKLEFVGEDSFNAIKQLVSCCGSQIKVYFAPIKVIELKKVPPNPSVPSTNFNCFYALKCVLSASYNVPDELYINNNLSEVNKMLKAMTEENPIALEKSLYDINSCMEKGCFMRFVRALGNLFNKYKEKRNVSQVKADITNRMVEMRRAILTPTRFVFLPPVPQLKSSLLENCDTDHAMRVTVRDDNFDQMTFTLCGIKENKIQFLNKFVGDKLAAGFKIGNRNYEFLGSSTSQLREHGTFFYAKDSQGRTAEDLRKSIGDVAQINNVPKYMARMGQSLSQAMVRINLPKKYVEGPVKDTIIKTPDGKEYNFTDGIGKISPTVAKMIYQALELDPDDKPSAFQIRYGGCKGMLVVDPTLGTQKKVIFRQSQWKFNSSQESLEILKVSKPQRAYLNRPFVTILDQMGVSEDHLLELQSSALNSIIGSLVDSEDAMKILKERATLRLPYSRLHHCGFDLSAEPFFKPMIMFLYRQAIGELKHKARIQLPFDYSRTMFGVVDETGTLEYGQLFFQYSDITIEGKISRTATVYTGTVLVTKNPCMHPGDVRKFEAVDVKELHHIKDCLVFPAQGPRPHPDEMAGSDLDGDEYVVIWYEKMFFERINAEPMDYSNDIKPIVNNNIKVEDMTKFMCQYILDDCVGLIASAHLALADSESIFGDRLIRIAKKYSVTLDFAKSGKPEELAFNERPVMYPDFMEKYQSKKSYLSNKCLGKLYRNCKRIEMFSEILDDEVEVSLDEDLIYEGWEEYKADAEKLLQEYIHLLMAPAKMFNITKEGEIMSGAIKKIEKTFQGKNSKENMDMALGCIIPNVFKKCRQKFMEEFLPEVENLPNPKGLSVKTIKDKANGVISQCFIEASDPINPKVQSNNVLEKMLRKISAWYVVAYRAKLNGSSACLGLPWTVPELMGLLKAQAALKRGGKSISVAEQSAETFIENLNLINEDDKNSMDVSEYTALVVQNVIRLWVGHYEKFLSIRGLNSEKPYIKNLVVAKSNEYLKENPKASAAQLTIRFLRDLSSHCYTVRSSQSYRDSELGMLALVTLSTLSTTGKLWYTTESERDAELKRMGNLTKDFREQIIFPLDLGKKGSKDNFKKFIIRNESSVRETLKNLGRLKNIDIDFREERPGKYAVILTVYGKLWCIEALKDFIIQPQFATILMKTTRAEMPYHESDDDIDQGGKLEKYC